MPEKPSAAGPPGSSTFSLRIDHSMRGLGVARVEPRYALLAHDHIRRPLTHAQLAFSISLRRWTEDRCIYTPAVGGSAHTNLLEMTPASILIAVVPLLARQASAGIFPRQEASSSAAAPAAPTADVSSVLASAVSSGTAMAATAMGTAVSTAANASFTSNDPASPSAGEASSSVAITSSGAATAAAMGAGTVAGTPSGDDSTSASGVVTATTSAVASGDFKWVQTSGLPTITTTLATTNRDAITPTATGPVGGQGTPAVNFTDYSSSSLEQFWNDWVRLWAAAGDQDCSE